MKNIRLQTVLDCIPKGSIIADIGTDHAYLPCEAIKQGKSNQCYACDIASGPLRQAEKTIHEYGFINQVTTILCPGLKLVPKDANVCVIAGMGWHTAHQILEDDFEKLSQFNMILVQLNKDVDKLREWISKNHFEIVIEKITFEDDHYYEIVGFVAKKSNLDYDYDEIMFGPCLIKDMNDLTRQYYLYRKDKLENILQQMDQSLAKAIELQKELEHLKQILKKSEIF